MGQLWQAMHLSKRQNTDCSKPKIDVNHVDLQFVVFLKKTVLCAIAKKKICILINYKQWTTDRWIRLGMECSSGNGSCRIVACWHRCHLETVAWHGWWLVTARWGLQVCWAMRHVGWARRTTWLQTLVHRHPNTVEWWWWWYWSKPMIHVHSRMWYGPQIARRVSCHIANTWQLWMGHTLPHQMAPETDLDVFRMFGWRLPVPPQEWLPV